MPNIKTPSGDSDATGKVPNSRTLTTTAPLTIDGGSSADLSADRTFALNTADFAFLSHSQTFTGANYFQGPVRVQGTPTDDVRIGFDAPGSPHQNFYGSQAPYGVYNYSIVGSGSVYGSVDFFPRWAGERLLFTLPLYAASVIAKNRYVTSGEMAAAGGATSPGGNDLEVQFNDATAFGGDPAFTWQKTPNILTASGSLVVWSKAAIGGAAFGAGILQTHGNSIADSGFGWYSIDTNNGIDCTTNQPTNVRGFNGVNVRSNAGISIRAGTGVSKDVHLTSDTQASGTLLVYGPDFITRAPIYYQSTQAGENRYLPSGELNSSGSGDFVKGASNYVTGSPQVFGPSTSVQFSGLVSFGSKGGTRISPTGDVQVSGTTLLSYATGVFVDTSAQLFAGFALSNPQLKVQAGIVTITPSGSFTGRMVFTPITSSDYVLFAGPTIASGSTFQAHNNVRIGTANPDADARNSKITENTGFYYRAPADGLAGDAGDSWTLIGSGHVYGDRIRFEHRDLVTRHGKAEFEMPVQVGIDNAWSFTASGLSTFYRDASFLGSVIARRVKATDVQISGSFNVYGPQTTAHHYVDLRGPNDYPAVFSTRGLPAGDSYQGKHWVLFGSGIINGPVQIGGVFGVPGESLEIFYTTRLFDGVQISGAPLRVYSHPAHHLELANAAGFGVFLQGPAASDGTWAGNALTVVGSGNYFGTSIFQANSSRDYFRTVLPTVLGSEGQGGVAISGTLIAYYPLYAGRVAAGPRYITSGELGYYESGHGGVGSGDALRGAENYFTAKNVFAGTTVTSGGLLAFGDVQISGTFRAYNNAVFATHGGTIISSAGALQVSGVTVAYNTMYARTQNDIGRYITSGELGYYESGHGGSGDFIKGASNYVTGSPQVFGPTTSVQFSGLVSFGSAGTTRISPTGDLMVSGDAIVSSMMALGGGPLGVGVLQTHGNSIADSGFGWYSIDTNNGIDCTTGQLTNVRGFNGVNVRSNAGISIRAGTVFSKDVYLTSDTQASGTLLVYGPTLITRAPIQYQTLDGENRYLTSGELNSAGTGDFVKASANYVTGSPQVFGPSTKVTISGNAFLLGGTQISGALRVYANATHHLQIANAAGTGVFIQGPAASDATWAGNVLTVVGSGGYYGTSIFQANSSLDYFRTVLPTVLGSEGQGGVAVSGTLIGYYPFYATRVGVTGARYITSGELGYYESGHGGVGSGDALRGAENYFTSKNVFAGTTVTSGAMLAFGNVLVSGDIRAYGYIQNSTGSTVEGQLGLNVQRDARIAGGYSTVLTMTSGLFYGTVFFQQRAVGDEINLVSPTRFGTNGQTRIIADGSTQISGTFRAYDYASFGTAGKTIISAAGDTQISGGVLTIYQPTATRSAIRGGLLIYPEATPTLPLYLGIGTSPGINYELTGSGVIEAPVELGRTDSAKYKVTFTNPGFFMSGLAVSGQLSDARSALRVYNRGQFAIHGGTIISNTGDVQISGVLHINQPTETRSQIHGGLLIYPEATPNFPLYLGVGSTDPGSSYELTGSGIIEAPVAIGATDTNRFKVFLSNPTWLIAGAVVSGILSADRNSLRVYNKAAFATHGGTIISDAGDMQISGVLNINQPANQRSSIRGGLIITPEVTSTPLYFGLSNDPSASYELTGSGIIYAPVRIGNNTPTIFKVTFTNPSWFHAGVVVSGVISPDHNALRVYSKAAFATHGGTIISSEGELQVSGATRAYNGVTAPYVTLAPSGAQPIFNDGVFTPANVTPIRIVDPMYLTDPSTTLGLLWANASIFFGNAPGSTATALIFNNQMKYTTANDVAQDGGVAWFDYFSFNDAPTYTPASGVMNIAYSYRSQPAFSRAGAVGSFVPSGVVGYLAALGTVGANVTIQERFGFFFRNGSATTGTLQNSIGIHVDQPTRGVGLNIGLRNYGSTVYRLRATNDIIQDIRSPSETIMPSGTTVPLTAGQYVGALTGAPIIKSGVDAQVITLVNVGSGILTLPNDQARGLHLAAGDCDITAGDSISLMYSADLGAWTETARATNDRNRVISEIGTPRYWANSAAEQVVWSGTIAPYWLSSVRRIEIHAQGWWLWQGAGSVTNQYIVRLGGVTLISGAIAATGAANLKRPWSLDMNIVASGAQQQFSECYVRRFNENMNLSGVLTSSFDIQNYAVNRTAIDTSGPQLLYVATGHGTAGVTGSGEITYARVTID